MEGWKHHLAGVALESAYFTGLARFAERKATGQGVILKFQRVRPRSSRAFQPLKGNEVSPSFLRQVIATLRRKDFDVISIADAGRRIKEATGSRRFAVLTFDGGYSDFKTFAYPILQSHDLPFTVYIPTGFIDGVAFPWWLTLEEVIAQTPRLSLLMGGEERRFKSTSVAEKYLVFEALYRWLRDLPPAEIPIIIKDLRARYRVRAPINDVAMSWADIATLAADPRATIGSATVNYVTLTRLSDAAALREMKMGRSVLESVLGRECCHFAYPFGDEGTFAGRERRLAEEAGFADAVTACPGLMTPDGTTEIFNLPRIAWNGRWSSTRILQVLVSGLTMPRRSPSHGTADH